MSYKTMRWLMWVPGFFWLFLLQGPAMIRQTGTYECYGEWRITVHSMYSVAQVTIPLIYLLLRSS